MTNPTLPYNGTEGHSGTDTSRSLAEDSVASAGTRQDAVLSYVKQCGRYGATVGEVRANVMAHHGAASRSLTMLHIGGKLARLAEVRNHAKVYVAPEFVDDRSVEQYRSAGNKSRHLALQEVRDEIRKVKTPTDLDHRQLHAWVRAIDEAVAKVDEIIGLP